MIGRTPAGADRRVIERGFTMVVVELVLVIVDGHRLPGVDPEDVVRAPRLLPENVVPFHRPLRRAG